MEENIFEELNDQGDLSNFIEDIKANQWKINGKTRVPKKLEQYRKLALLVNAMFSNDKNVVIEYDDVDDNTLPYHSITVTTDFLSFEIDNKIEQSALSLCDGFSVQPNDHKSFEAQFSVYHMWTE